MKDPALYLKDILDAIEAIERFTEGIITKPFAKMICDPARSFVNSKSSERRQNISLSRLSKDTPISLGEVWRDSGIGLFTFTLASNTIWFGKRFWWNSPGSNPN